MRDYHGRFVLPLDQAVLLFCFPAGSFYTRVIVRTTIDAENTYVQLPHRAVWGTRWVIPARYENLIKLPPDPRVFRKVIDGFKEFNRLKGLNTGYNLEGLL